MKAVRIHRAGRPAVLQLEDVAAPRPAPGEVLVEVRYAALNPVDAKIRAGTFAAYTAPLPAILGRDIAGIVRSVGGPGKRQPPFTEGTRVFGMLDYPRGAYAEYAVGSRRELAVTPDRLGDREAAALGVAGLTAWQGLFTHGRLRRGQRVLIHGGAGGVGHLALQFAKARGAWVAATARKADLAWLRSLGADEAIDYENDRFESRLSGLDLVFDLIGGETQERSWTVLKAKGGALVSTLAEPSAEAAGRRRARALRMVVQADRAQLEKIAALAASGRLRVRIAEVFPLARAREAHARLEAGGFRGKLLLAADSAAAR